MADPIFITAQDGDTLCTLAIAAGFKDCLPLRAVNPDLVNRPLVPGDVVTIPAIDPGDNNRPTDAKHVFQRTARQVGIRFVHGSRDRTLKDDLELTELNVSNYVTDKGGKADGDANFPDESVTNFNKVGNQDPDTFKVEVLDTRPTGNPLQVDIQPLRPVYSPADPSGETVTDHVEFPGGEKGRRGLFSIDAVRQGASSSKRFRTCYLRLVTDDADNNSVFGAVAPQAFNPATNNNGRIFQTIIASDMTDEGDPQVQILDQLVQATYTLADCPATPKCSVVKTATIGTDRQRLRIAVHILRRTPQGTPVATIAEADRRVNRWLRRIFAQASISPKFAQATREVDPVANLIAVSDPGTNGTANSGGLPASGFSISGAASQQQFRISANGVTPQLIGPITPVDPATLSSFTAVQTANALAALVASPFTATVTQNPIRFNDTLGSVDILIKESSGKAVTIDQLPSPAQADVFQTLTLGSVNPLPVSLQGWDGNNFLIGSIQQRVILKNYDTGDNRVDIFILDKHVSGDRGEAMMNGDEVNPASPAISGIKFSVFMIRDAIRDTGNKDNDPLVLAHEITHVTAEILHTDQHGDPASATFVADEASFAPSRPNPYQLMAQRVSGNEAPGASKRLRDGPCVYAQNGNTAFNVVARLRAKGSSLMEGW
jgi:hypothetical protein